MIRRFFKTLRKDTRGPKEGSPEKPTLSVLIPFYNNHGLLPECLQSIREHITSVSFEIIIADDGSPDTRFLRTLADPAVTVLYLEKQSGPAKARNAAIAAARGDFILFVDSDDVLTRDPAALIHQANALQADSRPDLLVGQEAENPLDRRLGEKAPFFGTLNSDPILARLHFFSVLLYRRDWLTEKQVRFRDDLPSGEDLAFLADALSCAGQMFVGHNAFYRYRRRRNSITQTALTHKQIACRLDMINHVCERLSPFPEACMLRALGAFKTNLNMMRRSTEELGRDTGLWFTRGLADWATLYISDDAIMQQVRRQYGVRWTANQDRILTAMRTGAPADTVLDLALAPQVRR
jgi:glycosyltransferase involved in cell wall biosynthesis